MRFATFVAAALLLPACNPDLEGDVLRIAVGAEVTLVLEPVVGNFVPNTCDRRAGVGCLAFQPAFLEEVELDEDDGFFELVGSRIDGDNILVTVRAKREGDAQLEVTMVTAEGDDVDQKFILRAEPLGDVAIETTHCETASATAPYLITPGSSISYRATANSRIAIGDLPLIADFGGFEPEDPSAREGTAVAPMEPGRHQLIPAGVRGRPMEIEIYAPDDVSVAFHDPDDAVPGIALHREVDGRRVCIHDADTRVVIETSPPICRPLVNGFEVVGSMPVTLRNADPVLQLTGDGYTTCLLTARKGDVLKSVNVQPHDIGRSLTPGTGGAIGLTGTPFGGEIFFRPECASVSEPEGFVPWEWEVNIRAHGENDNNYANGYVGVGLNVELFTTERYSHESGDIFLPPIDTTYSFAPSAGITFEETGCFEDTHRAIALRPDEPGDYVLTLDKTAGPAVAQYTVLAREVASAAWSADAPSDTTAWFIGNDARFFLDYRDADGNTLFGTAPIYVRSTIADSGATYDRALIYTGITPHVVELSSFLAAEVATFDIVDDAAIASFDGLTATSTSPGAPQCLQLSPRHTDGGHIHGEPPTRPSLQLTGESHYIDLTESEGICLVGATPGDTSVEVTWGSANDAATWSVE